MLLNDKGLMTVLGVSLLMIILALPLALGRIPRNAVYGFRIRATMESDALWHSANAHFGRGLIVATLGGALTAVAVYLLLPLSPETFLPISIACMALPSLIASLATLGHVRSVQRSRTSDAGK